VRDRESIQVWEHQRDVLDGCFLLYFVGGKLGRVY
jgi:hypothetical protein